MQVGISVCRLENFEKLIRFAALLFKRAKYPYEHETSMKKNFHHPVSELPPKQYGQSSLDGPNWLYDLAGNSETG